MCVLGLVGLLLALFKRDRFGFVTWWKSLSLSTPLIKIAKMLNLFRGLLCSCEPRRDAISVHSSLTLEESVLLCFLFLFLRLPCSFLLSGFGLGCSFGEGCRLGVCFSLITWSRVWV